YQRAVTQYVTRNSVQFDPIDFDITDLSGCRIMQASLYPEGMMLNEGKRKVCDVTLVNDDDSPSFIAKISHPVTGMTVYEMREIGDIVTIQANTDEMNGTRIEAIRPTWLNILFTCGCAFTRQKWNLITHDIVTAIVEPKTSFFEENSVKV
ncbi:hypothetical protein OSTOST_06824, partial [Ostertagia ostertagi]